MAVDPKNTADRTPHRNTVLGQLRAMQEVAFKRITSNKTEDKDLAQLMRAYVACEQQRNILRMRPAPKPIDVSGLRKNKRRAAARDASPVPTDAGDQAGHDQPGKEAK